MKRHESITLPSVKVNFTDTMSLLMMKEIYVRGYYPAFIEKMSTIVTKNPNIVFMNEQGKLSSHEHDTSRQELQVIKQMLEQMQNSQNMLMKQITDYSESMDIITSGMESMQNVTKTLQNSLTEAMGAIRESASSAEILDNLSRKDIKLDEVVKHSESLVSQVGSNLAQAPIKANISSNPIMDVKPPSVNSELADLNMSMFDDGLTFDEMSELATQFKGE